MVEKSPAGGALRPRLLARLAEADRAIIGLGIDIDEAPVDLAPRRPLLERRDRRTERRVGEHRPVDEHPVGGIGLASGRKLDADEIRARRPGDTALFEHAVEFAQREGRKGAGKAGGRACRGGEAGDVVEPLARAAVLPEMHDQPVFLLGHARRTVERERHAVPRIVGHRDEQVDRLTHRQQRPPLRPRRHRIEGIEQQAGENLSAEGRFEPARAHEARQLGAHLVLCALAHRAIDDIAAPLHRPAGDRHRPEFGCRR